MSRKLAALFMAAILLLSAGCASADSSKMTTTAFEAPAAAPMEASYAEDYMMTEEQKAPAMAAGSENGAQASDMLQSGQKIILNASLNMETRDFEASVSALTEHVKALGGYIQSSSTSGKKPVEWGDSGRNFFLTARIPAEKLDGFLTAAKASAELISQELGSENVTEHYYDTQARLDSYKLQLNTLETLLEKAEKLEDVITLEQEIARVRYEIESMESALRRYDSLIAYSTADITLYEITGIDRPQAQKPTFAQRISDALKDSGENTRSFLEELTVGLIIALPIILILAVLALAVFLIVRAIIRAAKKSGQKRALKEQQKKQKIAANAGNTGENINTDKEKNDADKN